jgi:hypothetical protein
MPRKTTEPKPKPKPKLTDAERHERFVETAKKVDASDGIEAFDKAFAKIASPALIKAQAKPKQQER